MARNWKNVAVLPSCPLSQVIRVIDQEALRIALVVDDDGVLQGTITDGDVRRALIAGRTLEASAQEAMNANPATVGPYARDSEIKAILRGRGLLALPVVNERGMLLGLRTLDSVAFQKSHDNPVFLMAGGFGQRLRPLTDDCPKPMLKVGDRPVLEIILSRFLESGFRNFYISTYYRAEMIKEYFGDGRRFGCDISYVTEESPLGTGGALSLLPKDLVDLPIIMMNGDVLTKVDFAELLAFHQAERASCTVCARQYELQIPYGILETKNYQIARILEKPTKQFLVNAGIYVIDRSFLDLIPLNTRIDMTDAIDDGVRQGMTISVFPVHEYWLDIGSMPDFDKAQREAVGLM